LDIGIWREEQGWDYGEGKGQKRMIGREFREGGLFI
jgi:hypothetical protein